MITQLLVLAFFVVLTLRLFTAYRLVKKYWPSASAFKIFRRASLVAFGATAEAFACPTNFITGCDFVQALVDETPRFDERIMEDITPTDGWIGNVATGTTEMGTPTEITQDRFRGVWPNTTKVWTRKVANGTGCSGNTCDPIEHQIGWGADRLTYYAEEQHWSTPIICYDQAMHITHAEQHIDQIISDVLRPATSAIHSMYLRKRHLLWSYRRSIANSTLSNFNFQWSLGGQNLDDEMYFDCSVAPTNVYKLVPQMLQRRWNPLMRKGYAGKNPFKDTAPYIELVSDMDTTWELDHLGGQTGVGGGGSPSVIGNWRFQDFNATGKYWKYGFSGQVGNFMVRVDPFNLRFNFIADLGAAANGGNGNRYRYQIVLPYVNTITTGAGGAAGIGRNVNDDYDNAQFRFSQIHHKMGMELLVPDAGSLNSEMPFGHRNFGGKWQAVTHDLGADINGVPIENKRQNKVQFIADFLNYIRPLHTEFLEVFFHKGEQFPIPQITPASADPGYPPQSYIDELPLCPLPAAFAPEFGTVQAGQWGPAGNQDGPIPLPRTPIPSNSADY